MSDTPAKAASFRTIDALDCAGKRVLLRADLNVPVREGQVTDLTRLERLAPTIRELADKGARVIVVSHFDRPLGKRVATMSLAPIGSALARVLGHPVHFAEDCLGPRAEAAVAALRDGEVLVLENTRFYPGEEANDPEMARGLAALADIYVNDAFSAAHRAHASTEGVARHLPAHAGRLMQAELDALTLALEHPERPVGAIVGGAKISTKLDLIGNIIGRVDMLIIGGAMANTFLAARGVRVGRSLQEPQMHDTARAIMAQAEVLRCALLLPVDAIVARDFKAGARSRAVPIDAVADDELILDCGPATVDLPRRADRQPEDPGLERTDGRLRDRAVRRRHHGPRPPRRRADPSGRPALGGRRRRHRLGIAPCRRARRVLLCLDRRRRLPRMAGRQDPARHPGADRARRDHPATLMRDDRRPGLYRRRHPTRRVRFALLAGFIP